MENNLICRLCLYNNENILPIFGEQQREAKLQEKLLQYVNLEVKEDDPLPKLICLKCFQTIESFHAFYQEVTQNQTVFEYTTQPGIMVISDQDSHTTYILKEDEVLAGSQQSCIEMDELSMETIQLRPSTSSSATVQISDQRVTLVQLPRDVVVGSARKTQPSVTSSGLPTYDESQKSRQVIAIVKDALGEEKIIIDRLEETEEESGIPVIIDQTASVEEPQTFTLVHEDPEDVKVALDSENDDDDDDDEPEEEILQIDDSDDELQLEKRSVSNSKDFPKKFIQDGQLVVRGKELSTLMGRFYDLTCEFCMEGGKDEDEIVSFTEMDLYLAHCKEMHATKGHVWCCSGRIIKPKMMALHMARHLQPEAFKCPECGKVMSTPQILQYHIQNHRPEEERPLQCRQCPRRFSYGSALLAHAQSHLPEAVRSRHVCDDCGKSFSSAPKLAEHWAVHGGTTAGTSGDGSDRKSQQMMTYVCQVCAKQFTSKSNLTYHLTTHQPKIHQVQCERCKKWLRNKLCLRKHMVQHSDTRHQCTYPGCEYSAVNLQCLRNHIRVQHSDVKPFECDVCGKSFKLKNTLLNHQVQHTGVKKFACEFCSRTFASSGNYYAHRKRMHPQELAVQKKRKEDEENEFRKTKLLSKSK
ncbi:hypothetical protein pipiens_012223 [Culex pipiens pipiens]|uniref:Transcription factor grauzone n=1 Tax=Culex pipiens pipiens TaxID=38569 RepID=A0ABD1D3C0_CULPP